MPRNLKKYTIAQTRAHLTDVLNQASYGKERIEVVRRNKPIAYIVPVEDIEMIEKLEDIADFHDAIARQDEPSIAIEEFKKELGL